MLAQLAVAEQAKLGVHSFACLSCVSCLSRLRLQSVIIGSDDAPITRDESCTCDRAPNCQYGKSLKSHSKPGLQKTLVPK